MAWRDRDWYINAVDKSANDVFKIQHKINRHIECCEYDAAKMLLGDLSVALDAANRIANEFADKFGG